MKKLLCSIIILAVGGFVHAEILPIPNNGFEDGMTGWSTWGSGSGSGPSGSKYVQHYAYIDTTGNAASGQNFLNLTTASQIGYCEYGGYGNNYVWRSDPAEIAICEPGDWVKMGVWAKDVGGYGGGLALRFTWKDWTGGSGELPVYWEVITVYPTAEWDYYSAWLQIPADPYPFEGVYYVEPRWYADSPGTEIGVDDLEFIPEPMSIALLAFGALALRRRK